jgi:hypothetical protein
MQKDWAEDNIHRISKNIKVAASEGVHRSAHDKLGALRLPFASRFVDLLVVLLPVGAS